ncbi:MAG: efflux RND transporter permease subunit [Myxococcales bacterium]
MLARFSVQRWQFTLVVFGALLALGVYALVSIPKAEDPTFPIPNFRVVAVLPGAQPQELERSVIDPIETKLSTLEDLKRIRSEARDGVAVIFAEFHPEIDSDRKHDEVQREVNALRGLLPAQLSRLDVTMYNAANVHVLELALTSDGAAYRALDSVARRLKRRLESVTGVGDVQISGLPKREVTVTLHAAHMVANHISPLEIYRAISEDSASVPAGSIEVGARRMNVVAGGEYESLDEIRSTVIRTVDGVPLTVGQVADVVLTDAEASHIARFDGQRAVLIAVAAREGQSVLQVMKAVDTELAAFEPTLPSNVRLQRGFEQAVNVERRLGMFARDFLLAIVIVLATLLPLGLRAATVVMVSIPLSLSIGVFLLKQCGFSVNQLSLVGFVLALGLLVDDSVVVVENITRHVREGRSPREAAVRATQEISASVLGCTATLILAFVPLLALPGASGQFIRSMPLALVLTVGASLLVSLTVVPFLASILIKPEAEHGNAFFRGMIWLVEGAYRPILGRALAHPYLTLVATALLFAGSIALIPRVGFSLFPKAEIPQFLVKVEAGEGASLAETDRATRYVEAVLARHPEVSRVASTIGKGQPQIYYNVQPAAEKTNTAEVFAQADSKSPERRAKLFQALRQELATFAGARIELFEFENGPPVEAPIALRLISDDEAALRVAAGYVEKQLKETRGTRDVKNPMRARRTDLRIELDRERAGLVGVSLPAAEQMIRLAVGGVRAGSFRESGADEAYAVRLTLPREQTPTMGGARPGLEVLEALHVPNHKGDPVPLTQFSRDVFEPSATTIRHHNRERGTTVSAFVEPGFNVGHVTNDVLSRIAQRALAGVRLVPAGELETRNESFGGLGVALIVAAFGILGVLVLEFGNFKGTAIVASVIPLGVIGGVLALWFSGNALSFIATVGFIALMGIEVKNSILLVDFTNHLRAQGASIDDAIMRAGETRFVPVLLTTLTAIGGLIPLILSKSALYSPLAWVILGGLISSTILTRIVTPVLYRLLAPRVELHAGEGVQDAAQSFVSPESLPSQVV